MKKIHIITHCYAERLPQYVHLLQYHLSAICGFGNVQVTVCTTETDSLTLSVCDKFQQFMGGHRGRLMILVQPTEAVGRRAIGRNQVAKHTEADLVIFSDVDYVWTHEALNYDRIFEALRIGDHKRIVMVYPSSVQISKDHATGDAMWQTARDYPHNLMPLHLYNFIPKHYDKAIGGCQIVTGDFARQYGYLPDSRWQQPREDDQPFHDFRDDRIYRQHCLKHGQIIGLPIPGVFRIRHSEKTHV